MHFLITYISCFIIHSKLYNEIIIKRNSKLQPQHLQTKPAALISFFPAPHVSYSSSRPFALPVLLVALSYSTLVGLPYMYGVYLPHVLPHAFLCVSSHARCTVVSRDTSFAHHVQHIFGTHLAHTSYTPSYIDNLQCSKTCLLLLIKPSTY